MGRPAKLTAEVSENVVRAVRAGSYPEPAARAAGISPATYYRWMARGRSDSAGVYTDFVNEIEQAQSEAEVHAVAILRRAMNEDWRAALAYLERRYPGRWRRHTSTELTGPDGGPVQMQAATTDLSQLSDDDLKTLREIHARAAATD